MAPKIKTKIICTLGPASSDESILRKMMLSGMDVVRLNFSHGNRKDLIDRIKLVRLLNKKYRRSIKILGDLQGHRIRVGDLSSSIDLKNRQVVWLVQKNIKGAGDKIPFDYKGDLRTIKNGFSIFIDDGNISLEVIGRSQGSLKTKVLIGGLLKEHKGINIPQAKLEFGDISKKDIDDIHFCEEQNIDYIAQSFVRAKEDILEVKNIIDKNTKCKIIAKIENQDGINNVGEIIKVSDGVMIARGDMGVSVPIYKIPIIQKIIIKKCNIAGKFVITATQMLDSMVINHRPTRAEVTDVANAVIDGTDFVMLSAESAIGKYPVQTVTMMNNIIKFTEGYLSKNLSGKL